MDFKRLNGAQHEINKLKDASTSNIIGLSHSYVALTILIAFSRRQ